MFKSVFAKYLTAFTVIIAIRFMLIIFVVSTMVSNYSYENKKTLMQNGAYCAEDTINTYRSFDDSRSFSETVEKNASRISDSLHSYAENADSAIFVMDPEGTLLASSSNSSLTGKVIIPQGIITDVTNGTGQYEFSDLGGTFSDKRRNLFSVIREDNGNVAGIILVSSTNVGDTLLVGTMQKTIIAASLWVFLAGLISLYVISRRISEPMKNIAQTAKSFALGKFDARAVVSSHDEVGELAAAFNNMASSLEKIEEQRNSFIANVSHDLRTPMTVIAGYVDGLIDGTIPDEKREYYLGIISSEVRRLSRLVTTLLQLSRMQSGREQLNKTVFNITEKARQVLLSFEKKIEEKKFEVEFNSPEDIYVNADTDAIHQVLYNLCDNAVKFTPEGGRLSITIEKRDKKAFIAIRNTGDGIPEEELPYIFDRFYKSDRSRGLDKTGTGLGLFIAKTNVNRHGEELCVKSVYGEFCEFSFTLPAASK